MVRNSPQVISLAGQKMSMSMRDVDQTTGQDLLPMNLKDADRSNPTGPSGGQRSALHGLSGIQLRDSVDPLEATRGRRAKKRLTSPEKWEVKQLISSGVLDVSEYPTFDEVRESHAVAKPAGFAPRLGLTCCSAAKGNEPPVGRNVLKLLLEQQPHVPSSRGEAFVCLGSSRGTGLGLAATWLACLLGPTLVSIQDAKKSVNS
jgi:hypothetical protein